MFQYTKNKLRYFDTFRAKLANNWWQNFNSRRPLEEFETKFLSLKKDRVAVSTSGKLKQSGL